MVDDLIDDLAATIAGSATNSGCSAQANSKL